MKREIGVIHDELRCNAINIFGSDLERLIDTATTALDSGVVVEK